MLSLTVILIAYEILCHAILALLHLLHLWPTLVLSHQTRDTWTGLLYAGLAVALAIRVFSDAH
ncbi:MAG TPA: hypothetical protein VES73_18220 [Lamprocystis sp. (in: g-proteobacteria)]|nr:hypothetical protein [Lamprocystis sp. (in: g-proteobacteria)]